MTAWLVWNTHSVNTREDKEGAIACAYHGLDNDYPDWPEIIEAPDGTLIQEEELEALTDEYGKGIELAAANRRAKNPIIAYIDIKHPTNKHNPWVEVEPVWAEKPPWSSSRPAGEEGVTHYQKLWESRVGKDRVRVRRMDPS